MVCIPMSSREKTGFLVLVADWTEVGTDDFKIGVLPDIVFCHFEHAEVKVCDGAEGATCDEDNRSFVRVAENSIESVVGKRIVWRVCERVSKVDIWLGHGCAGERGNERKVVKWSCSLASHYPADTRIRVWKLVSTALLTLFLRRCVSIL